MTVGVRMSQLWFSPYIKESEENKNKTTIRLLTQSKGIDEPKWIINEI